MSESNKYSERIVAFIDILGFSKYIEESDKDKEKASNVFKLITDLKSKIKKDYNSEFRKKCATDNEITSISDSIIISHPLYRNKNLGKVVLSKGGN